MPGSFRVGSVAGIDIRVHYTWLFAVVLIASSLAVGYYPGVNASFGTGTDWLLGFISALLLFASVLVHELAHSLVARARGIQVESITLFIFGGVSNIAREAPTAADEFLVAVVGPLTSLLLAVGCWLLAGQLPQDSVAGAVTTYLAFANLALGIFNLVPGFPLDGGRVLRAIVWAVTGNRVLATQTAAYLGQAVAFGLILWGVARVLSGDVTGGVWIAFTGWFLSAGAMAARNEAMRRPDERPYVPAPAERQGRAVPRVL